MLSIICKNPLKSARETISNSAKFGGGCFIYIKNIDT